MGFIPITLEKYIAMNLEHNPNEKEADLRKRLELALHDYKNGIKCSCGNDIWVIGSAALGNSCFTCITGEKHPSDDFEIDSAIIKRENIQGRRHIDDMDPSKIAGFFDDGGYEINPEWIKKPALCLICKNNNHPAEEILCTLTRIDQKDDKEFQCFAFIQK